MSHSRHRPSGLHRLDPRTKIAGFLLLGTATFLTVDPLAIALAYAVVLTGASLSSIRPGTLILRTRFVFWFVVVIVVANAFTVSGRTLFRVFGLYVTEDGVYRGAMLASRIILLLWMSVLLVATTTTTDFTDAVDATFRPLGRRWHAFATMVTLTVNYVPSLIRSARQIKMAQVARGADFDSGMFAQIRFAFSASIPLFVSALRTSSRLALAMEARGFEAGTQRSRYSELQMDWRDWLSLGALVILSVLMVVRIFRH